MKKMFCSLIIMLSGLTAVAEGSGNFCKDRVAAIEWFSYELGRQEAKLDMDDNFKLFSSHDRKVIEDLAKNAEKNRDDNKAEYEKNCNF